MCLLCILMLMHNLDTWVWGYYLLCKHLYCILYSWLLVLKNPYYTTTVSLSCSVVILNAFANMWTFSAISFPIIWGPISYFYERLDGSNCYSEL